MTKGRDHIIGARFGIMLMLALMLLMQSLSLQASVQMLPLHPPVAAHASMGCEPQEDCDAGMSQAECCVSEYQHHCSSGLCSVAALGLIAVSPLAPVSANTPPESAVAPLASTPLAPPSPPPKTL